MIYFFDIDGRCVRAQTRDFDINDELMQLWKTTLDFHTVVKSTDVHEFGDVFLENGSIKIRPAAPSRLHAFNWQTKQWEDPRTLSDLKAAQWDAIKQARSHAEYAGFMWDGSTFDSDAISQNRITGAVALAQMSSAFSIGWVLADNTVRTLGQADMLQVGAALGAHVAAIFAKGVGLRASIEAAATPEQVAAVAW